MGKPGAYHDTAAKHYFGLRYAEPQYHSSFDGVFEAVTVGAARYGVTAVENSIVGALSAPHDLLRSSQKISIVGEIILRINHCLAGIEGATLKGIQEVRSHPAALAQCEAFLSEQLPQVTRRNASDTASALLEIMQTADPTIAAIADHETATKFGLGVLASNIADSPNNQTRFVVLARRADEDSPILRLLADKTSFLLAEVEDRELAIGCFNMAGTPVQRNYEHPLPNQPGQYSLFVDVGGGADGLPVLSAVNALDAGNIAWRELGTYQQGKVV